MECDWTSQRSLLWPLSITGQFLLFIVMLKLMNLNMSLIVTSRCVVCLLELEKTQILPMHRRNFYFVIENQVLACTITGTYACTYCKIAKWKHSSILTMIKPKFVSTSIYPVPKCMFGELAPKK